MSVWRAIRAEYRFNFGNPKRLIPILAIFMIPILYAGTFLWAFWDPYGHLNRLPVAVVNDDRGATTNGQHIAAGDSLVNQLKAHDFAWRFVNDSQATAHPELASDPAFQSLLQSSESVATGAAQLSSAQSKLVSSAAQLEQGQGSLTNGMDLFMENLKGAQAGSQTLLNQEPQLVTGAQQLAAGMSALQSGANQLQTGTSALNSGVDKFSNGVNQLQQGAGQMASNLNQAKKKMPVLHRDQQVKATSNPVGLTHVQQGAIQNYGYGFAPYFLSLGLFVGALLMSIVIAFREPAQQPASALAWFISKFVLVISVSLAQSLIADIIILEGLGLHVSSPFHFVLFSLLTSFTFTAIVQFLVTSLANPGRFLSLLLLILQLTSSSGTYPVILSPAFFQKIHPYLPMTYTVNGFRYLIGGGDVADMRMDVWVLVVIAIVFLACSGLYFWLRYRLEQGDGGNSALAAE